MTIEIWSDIMCPFCYIGKRHLEAALARFEHRSRIQVQWRSFQLDPQLPEAGKQNVYQYLADRKGMSYAHSVAMHQQVTAMAAAAGLDYHFENTVVTNSFQAHRLIQLTKSLGMADKAEELLFKAYFEEGEDLGRADTLIRLAVKAGVPPEVAERNFHGTDSTRADALSVQVLADIQAAHDLRIQGVPYFLFDRSIAVSGAQPAEVFLQALTEAYGPWQKRQPEAEPKAKPGRAAGRDSDAFPDGDACSVDGNC